MGNDILLFVPNIIGYVRLLLLAGGLVLFDNPFWFLILYGSSILLDGVDGYAARKLNQTSVFGAWFDVIIDLISRGALWCFLYKWGYFIIMIEWMTFVGTHQRGAKWKIPEEDFPTLCKMVMANGFKTPLGAAAVGGIHLLPVWLYAYETGYLTHLSFPLTSQYIGIVLLTAGRALCAAVELFYIVSHIKQLLQESDKD